ncbi:MAG: 4-hydroxy-tetrahydrodipicolinate reductase [Tissierellia bacterium]|nr:4-hydroxy-tetrahydrodipicolinate reductase [Tissierellia bacterium]
MKIIISGAQGAMGNTLVRCAEENPQCEIIMGIDNNTDGAFPYEIVKSPDEICPKADVIVDFSNHSLLPSLLKAAVEHKIPMVIGTTGITDFENALIDEAAKSIAILQSGNMSIGIALMKKLAAICSESLPDFDIEIIEAHHHRKVDSPSGTAEMLLSSVKSTRPEADAKYGRHGRDTKRNPNEITIHSLRAGSIVGEHEVLFGGPDEIMVIKHTALSRDIFAQGAMKAAFFVANAPIGRYTIDDIIGGSR